MRLTVEEMVMANPDKKPFLYVASALRKCFPMGALIGVVLGFLHLILWSFGQQETLAQLVWTEEISMQGMLFATLFLLLTGFASYPFRHHRFHSKIAARLERLIEWLTHKAAFGACLTFGLGLVAVFTGAASHAMLIVLFILYLVALMELSTGIWRPQGLSRASSFLISILICAPVVGHLL